jgi:hypothetical protein
MKVYLAAIQHKNGTNLVAGGSKEELLKKLADYCRQCPLEDWCGEWRPDPETLIEELTDQDCVEKYFEGHPCEWVEEDSDEIALPGIDITVSDDAFDQIEQMLDAPAAPSPDLRRLMQEGLVVFGTLHADGGIITSGIVTNGS